MKTLSICSGFRVDLKTRLSTYCPIRNESIRGNRGDCPVLSSNSAGLKREMDTHKKSVSVHF